MAPAADFPAMEADLRKQFQYGYLDPDILHSLESQVPPGDIRMVSAFRTESVSLIGLLILIGCSFSQGGLQLPFVRTYVAKIEQTTRLEKEAHEEELAANLRAAEFKHLVAKLDADMKVLESRDSSSPSQAVETAKDLKYLWERQMKLAQQPLSSFVFC